MPSWNTRARAIWANTLYALIFILLFAAYTSAAFPLGDDVTHLFGYADHPFPVRNGWIANRVVDAFFNRYLFLIYHPLDSTLTGSSFFDSFARYTGLINTSATTLLAAILSQYSLSGLKTTAVSRLAALACSLALALRVSYGDTTHAIAYNMTLLICLTFILAVFPLAEITDLSECKKKDIMKDAKFYSLIVAGYFTAFGLELFALFAWIYFLAVFIATAITVPSEKRTNISKRLKHIASTLISTQRKTLILYYSIFTATSILVLLRWSGRARIGVNRKAVNISPYASDFLRGLLANRISVVLICGIALVACLCFLRYWSTGRLIEKSQSTANALDCFRPLVFIVILNVAYLILLFVAGYRDGNVFVAPSASASVDIGRNGRSILFLSPLLFVNLALCLRCTVISLATLKSLAPVYMLFSLVILLSSSNRFLMQIRQQNILKSNVEEAFVKASTAIGDIIDISFCLPRKSRNSGGYPVLPTAEDGDWYIESYRSLFRYYYDKEFSERGPVFKSTKDATAMCRDKGVAK